MDFNDDEERDKQLQGMKDERARALRVEARIVWLKVGLVVALFVLVFMVYLWWIWQPRPTRRIVARDEPGGVTRYVIERQMIGSFYGRNWDLTFFSLPEAKASLDRLEALDRQAELLNKAKWRVVE